jgi:hypothetical protein
VSTEVSHRLVRHTRAVPHDPVSTQALRRRHAPGQRHPADLRIAMINEETA